jgi:hypothetical protein
MMKEYEDILMLACKLETCLNEDILYGSKNFRSLADILWQNRFEFNTARFFSINKSTLFRVLYVMITFLIVIIQFKMNL